VSYNKKRLREEKRRGVMMVGGQGGALGRLTLSGHNKQRKQAPRDRIPRAEQRGISEDGRKRRPTLSFKEIPLEETCGIRGKYVI